MSEPAAGAPAPLAPVARRGPGRTVALGAVVFVLTGVVVLTLGAFLEPEGPPPLFAIRERAAPQPDGSFQVTLDTSDQARWRGFSLGLGEPSADPESGDLQVKRYQLRAPAGAADLGAASLASAEVRDDADWIDDTEVSGQVQNPALSSWYTYSYWTHRLLPKGHIFAVRRRGGGLALVEILSYYCDPDAAGCLTFRYRLP